MIVSSSSSLYCDPLVAIEIFNPSMEFFSKKIMLYQLQVIFLVVKHLNVLAWTFGTYDL
jgi:hypothetical protein